MEELPLREKAIILILIFAVALSASQIGLISELGYKDTLIISEEFIPSQNDDPLVIVGNHELAEISSAGVGTRSDPYIIQGRTIQSSGTCIRVEDTTAFFIINGGEYTPLMDVTVITQLPEPGIIFNGVAHGTIRNCRVFRASIGINLIDVRDCVIENVMITGTDRGIALENSYNCTIRDSRIFHNYSGIGLLVSSNSNLINNTIYANEGIGLEISFYSENNSIYRNRLGWNDDWNAVDNGANSIFTDGTNFGNSWSDYSGTGAYTVHGVSKSNDTIASKLEDRVRPSMIDITDVIIDVESTEEYLHWSCYDVFQDRYIIFINNIEEVSEVWEEEQITLRIDELPAGTHEIVLNVTDAAGNMNSDSVTVTVISFMLGGIGTELVMIASGITVILFLVVIVFIKKVL